ncbi:MULTISPECIES: SDR family NAD(P)-dependent oxidoreductase [Pseudonocardia]|uniref:3-oxoacyl-[acyl-carrier-protein] reductase FabG n=2 Tax=Pseudonocardia TaxID=1847 RepID=A0A1Y2MTV4_PSEAH|nr:MULTISPECIES: SDR family oxidoreductase [Pseudonocardia]OSY38207.1 3-oxoacyl-[acyl-carrier-protein] reductase FabG [Pseudonocardia autotrophica]TDN71067.1 3-oxoacyl-[acyl-carrier protein] reductase [Pseudonocardia autotrophica]BBG01736.1 3-oxoacyl-ACP reductase [Pseudonocardia autotrophica]GEC27389.1 3-oxoacyl-ACP reductase [Pseudonocardia saturnea]
MDLQLTGTNVLISGAGQGLGRALGLGFAAEGANVAFHYHSSAEGAEKSAAEAAELGVRSIAVGGDLRDADAVAAIVARTEDELGPICVLVNNSAVTKKQRFLESTPQDWAPQVDVTVTGTLQLTHAVATRMAEREAGSIVNLMGDSGRVGESGLLVTATARSTTVGLTRSLAKELARHKIRANAVSLALVRTDNFDAHAGTPEADTMKKILSAYPLRRFGHPDDITPMVLLLASPLSSWTTGQVVSVNGGYAMP